MNVQLWNSCFQYTIRKYLPLNQQNYRLYQAAGSLAERCGMLEKILTGNILSFAKGVGIRFDGMVKVAITDIPDSRLYTYKEVRMNGFDLEFRTNVSLPDHIGLGKGASLGFGVIKRNNQQPI